MGIIYKPTPAFPLAVYIYEKEHPPAHVHTFWETEEAIVDLTSLTFRRKTPNLNEDEYERILAFVTEHRDFLLHQWQRITGLPLK